MPSKCVVRGSINHDEYFFVDEISKPGETKSSKRYESRIGGKGANQAVSIVRAGADAEFYGTVGKDGRWIVEALGEMGIETRGVVVSDEDTTGRAIIQVSDDGENSIILFPGANHSDIHERQKSSDASGRTWFPGCTHLLLQNEISFQSTLRSLEKGKEEGLCTVFNPSPMLTVDQIRSFPWEKVDWLLINEGERDALLSGLTKNGSKAGSVSVSEELGSFQNFKNVVCTLGAEGVVAFIPAFRQGLGLKGGGIHVRAASLLGEFRDTTGAGDCFTGYFVAGIMEEFAPGYQLGIGGDDEAKIIKILAACNQAAGMCVERPGTIDSVPTGDEVLLRMGQ